MDLRQSALMAGLLLILMIWSVGIGWVVGLAWTQVALAFLGAGVAFFWFHHRHGLSWMRRGMAARRAVSPLLDALAQRVGLTRQPALYVTRRLASGINAFAVSGAEGDAIFVTPEVWALPERIQAPIFAHELAHIRYRDSVHMGFVSAFGAMVGAVGRTWAMLLYGGVVGWALLLVLWPVLLLIHGWSALTLSLYQPFAAALMREREFRADRAAARLTSQADMARALQTLEWYNRRGFWGRFRPHAGPLATHPPVAERIRRLEEDARRVRRRQLR